MTGIHIEGMTGSGKGFFLKYLKNKYPYFNVITMNEVTNISNMLDLQSGKSRWSFYTEMDFLNKHYENSTQCIPNTMNFIENSVFSSKACYFAYLDAGGFFTPLEKSLYEAWYKTVMKRHARPRVLVYLKSPNIQHHFERIINNSKTEQCGMTLSILKNFQALYDAYINQAELAGIPVIRITCPPCFEDNQCDMDCVVQTMLESLKTLTIST